MIVYDDEHRAAALARRPAMAALRTEPAADGGWVERTPGRFASASGRRRLGRLALPPPGSQPGRLEGDRGQASRSPGPPRATLITDFNSYNTDVLPEDEESPRRAARPWFQPHWVGDLDPVVATRRCTKPRAACGSSSSKAGVSNRCEIDLATGRATLFHGDTALGDAGADRDRRVRARTSSRSPTSTTG